MRVHAVNAFEGDSLLLESGDGRFALIDGGPRGTYEAHLREYLGTVLGRAGGLSAVVVSHVDADHIVGILDLVADIERALADSEPAPFEVADLWHNSFGETLDDSAGNLVAGIEEMAASAGRAQVALGSVGPALLGIREGAALRRFAAKLGIPLNGAFGGGLISPDLVAQPVWALGDVTVRVIGPTAANLRELRAEWAAWIARNNEDFALGDVHAMANADKSVPNLSSIVLYVTRAHRSALLTGDARGDHLLQGLESAGLMPAGGRFHVDLLKVQHHGSDRNATREFFDRVTADHYLFSANGKHGNPDIATLRWVVDAASAAGRTPCLLVTNQTESLDRLLEERPPAQYGYTLKVRPPDQHALVIDIGT